jgi:CRISPR-associated exonuclease Cas4
MAYSEDELLPVSALSQFVYCERRAALIHIEQQWADNVFTAEGQALHEKAHAEESETRGDLRIVRGLRIRSLRLGVVGVADVVEFTRTHDQTASAETSPGAPLPGLPGRWRPKPVEYKRGRPKPDHCDLVQLCAQACCLEEMLAIDIPAGAIFYGRPRRRLEVSLDPALRAETEELCQRLHELFKRGVTPPAVFGKKCKSCSLLDICRPEATASRSAAARYVTACLRELDTNDLEMRSPDETSA